MAFYIFHRHKICLVDHVYLICSLYNLWEDLGSSSLVTLPLGFSCGFISTSAFGSVHWGLLLSGGLGSAPMIASCGGVAAAWIAGVLAVPGTQGSWQLVQQEI